MHLFVDLFFQLLYSCQHVTIYISSQSVADRWFFYFQELDTILFNILVRQYAPRFTIRPDVLYNVMAGGNLNITCVAVGSPMPYVRWIKDGERLGEPSNAPIGRNVLELLDIRESVNYTCYAQSILGTIFVKTQVKVQGKPNFINNQSSGIMWSYLLLVENIEKITFK